MISNSFVSAKLKSLRKMHVFVYTSLPRPQHVDFSLVIDDEYIKLVNYRQNSTNGIYIFDIDLPFDFPFGKYVTLNMTDFGNIAIDLSGVINFPEFDDLFNYDGDDLGANYTKEATSFTLWAPLATSVILELENSDNTFSKHSMQRSDKGVYRLTIKDDLLNRKYRYVVNNNGGERITTDPYGKGATKDSIYSAVVDIASLRSKEKIKPTNEIKNYASSVIYEMHIRDFTEGSGTNIVNKGKYLGVIEENRKSKFGEPVALDYLKYLDITHVQILPILDFNSHDIYDSSKEYNWGYDPVSMFAIEGQYCTKPDIAMNRLEEFREMVDVLHKNNIRVVVDVVYNHMFEYLKTSLEAVVPNYFFRKRPNGTASNASGCGNDYASERFMASKAIVDSCIHLLETFDIDGFRFDLMGLIDIDTMNKIEKEMHKRKKDFIIYGEGWNMGLELPEHKKTDIDNSHKTPNIGFFNDCFRDILKGPTFQDKIRVKGFINGDFDYVNGYHYSFLGSVSDFCFNSRFNSTNQSINYVECHDNNTLFDKLTYSNENEDKEILYKRIKLANALTILSFGVPFIHMGQEIGQSKFGFDNTYNVPKINNFDLEGLHERWEMVTYLKSLISLRNNELSFFKNLTTKEEIDTLFNFARTENGLLIVESSNNEYIAPFGSIKLLINIHSHPVKYNFSDYHHVLFNNGVKVDVKDFNIKSGTIGAASIEILVTDKE